MASNQQTSEGGGRVGGGLRFMGVTQPPCEIHEHHHLISACSIPLGASISAFAACIVGSKDGVEQWVIYMCVLSLA